MFEIGTATDGYDLAEKLNTFLKTNGSAFGLTYSGTGNGTFTAYSGGASSVAETFTITATSATNWTVVGSVSGSIGPATTGTPFNHAKVKFTITAGGTAFVAGDVFTISTAPKYTALRAERGCLLTVTPGAGSTGINAIDNLLDGKLISDSDSFTWRAASPTLPVDIEINFFAAETLVQYGLMAGYYLEYAPKTWTFDYWDGAAWQTLDTQTDYTDWQRDVVKWFTIGSPVASKTRYRIHITATPFASLVSLGAFQARRTADTGIDIAFNQYIWKAFGNDGNSEIFMGIHVFRRLDADYQDWEMVAFDGYTASVPFYSQVGIERFKYLPLWDDTIPYWFACNGRGFRVLAKVNNNYEPAFIEFDDAYFSPDQLPAPMMMGAPLVFTNQPTWKSTSFRWSNSTDEHRAPTHSDRRGTTTPTSRQCHLSIRRLAGDWKGAIATSNDAADYQAFAFNAGACVIWPYSNGLSLLDANLDGSTALWPVFLTDGTPNSWGQIDGVMAISGQGLSAETLLRRGMIDWIVVQNIHRTDRDDFLAMALD